MEMIPLISFIIPLYNAKRTLERCVYSVISQGLKEREFEVILVNDGSNDGSEAICLDMAAKHDFIRVISQDNKGVSEARNNGIRASRGKYLCFVDSDDSLIPGGISPLTAYCDGKNDLVRFWCKLVYPGGTSLGKQGDGTVYYSGSGHDFLCRYGLENFCWNYLYKKEFVEKNNLFFTPGIVGEDFPFMFDVMMANPQIVSVARRIYLYNIHSGSRSNTRSSAHSRRRVNDLQTYMIRIARTLDPFRDSDPILYQSCRSGLDKKTRSLISRSLSAKYSIKEFRSFISSCFAAGLLPLQSKPDLLVRILSHFPFLYPLASISFVHIFLPYIYPHINRYGK